MDSVGSSMLLFHLFENVWKVERNTSGNFEKYEEYAQITRRTLTSVRIETYVFQASEIPLIKCRGWPSAAISIKNRLARKAGGKCILKGMKATENIFT